MKDRYLEVTFRRGRPLAAYLYLPRALGAKCDRSEPASPGLLVDYSNGKPIGIEITAPGSVTVDQINTALGKLGIDPLQAYELAPLKAA